LNELFKLSEQELLDCSMGLKYHPILGDSEWMLDRCWGGTPALAFLWLMGNVHITKPGESITYPAAANIARSPVHLSTTDSYPYTPFSTNTKCLSSSKTSSLVSISQFEATGWGDVNGLMVAVSKGPVTVTITGTAPGFKFYTNGILDSTTECNTLKYESNHQVVIVGYGTSDDSNKTPYWIVRNTWGAAFGENGYVRIKRGMNICGIESIGLRPIIA